MFLCTHGRCHKPQKKVHVTGNSLHAAHNEPFYLCSTYMRCTQEPEPVIDGRKTRQDEEEVVHARIHFTAAQAHVEQ